MDMMQSFTNKAKILVLFANCYDMVADGRQVAGCSVHYLFWGEQGEALLEQSEYDVSKPVGVQRAKVSMDSVMRVRVPIAPAIYEGTFETRVGGDGKPVLRLVDIAYYSNVEFKERIVPGLVVPGMVIHKDPETQAERAIAAAAAAADVPDKADRKSGK